jgi:hypothetical protein
MVAALAAGPFVVLLCALDVSLHLVAMTMSFAVIACVVGRVLGAFQGLASNQWHALFRAAALATALMALFAVFLPIESPHWSFRLGALTLLWSFSIVLVSLAGIVAWPRIPSPRRSLVAVVVAVGLIGCEAIWSTRHPAVTHMVATAPSASVRGDSSGRAPIAVGMPGDWVTIEAPPPARISGWNVHDSSFDEYPRSVSARRTPTQGRYVVEIAPVGAPNDGLDYRPGKSFVADARYGEVALAFAWLGGRARMPLPLVGFALATTALGLALLRRDRITATAIAWLGVGPVGVWRLVAYLFS